MKLCPKCNKQRRELQKIVKGKKGKKYLITFCGSCLYNFDIEDSDGGTPPQDVMLKPGLPLWENGTFLS
jgi:hypothetical protein